VSGFPSVVVFDVNETLSDLGPMADHFAEVGAPPTLASTWFAAVLRDGFGLTAAGAAPSFEVVARGVLRTLLSAADVAHLDAAVDTVMSGFASLRVHSDVPVGVRALRASGRRLVTLSNGSVRATEALLGRARLRDAFDLLLAAPDSGAWKPARSAYLTCAEACAVPPEEILLVAVHPWDVDGAARVGLRTAWIDRSGGDYPGHLTPPDIRAAGVDDLARQLSESGPVLSPGPPTLPA